MRRYILAFLFVASAAIAGTYVTPVSGVPGLSITGGLTKSGPGTLTIQSNVDSLIWFSDSDVLFGSSLTSDSNGNIMFGRDSTATEGSVVIGHDANGLETSVLVGNNTSTVLYGVAVGESAISGSTYAIAMGINSYAGGNGSVAIGGGLEGFQAPSVVPFGWSDTVTLGSGTATLNGGLNFRGFGVVGYNGGSPALASGIVSGTAVYAAGTAYTLTSTNSAMTFGTTNPAITIPAAGTWLVFGRAYLKYNGATYIASQTASVKLRRTNNTAADVANAATTATLRVITTITDSVGIMSLPSVLYTTSNADDSVTLFGILSAAPSAGSVQCTEASITAIRISGT